jgi:tetratricopeptide (TPR) repeat protein
MNEAASIETQQTDRIITIGFGLVILFAAAQLAAVGLHYGLKARTAYVASHPTVTAVPTPPPRAAAAPAVTGVPGAEATTGGPASAVDGLLRDATALNERGDTTNALAKLQEAIQRDPKNANVLAEMARIYESIQAFDRSNEMWRKIQEIGPAAGALYELADMKLKLGVAAPAGAAAEAAGPGLAGVSPLDTGTARDDDGIPEGSTFGISDVGVNQNDDPDAETNLTLRIAIKARPNAIGIDHTKVKIQVFFYDTIDNKDVALTDADVTYEWVTPNHDWKSTNPEVLGVTYVRPKNRGVSTEEAAQSVTPGKKTKPKSSSTSGGRRKYLGYIVRIYYNDQLQAVRADPTKLLNLFPPPFTAPSQ